MEGKTIKAGATGETGVLVQGKSYIRGSFSYKINGKQVSSKNVDGTKYSYGMRFMLFTNDDRYSGVWIEVRDDLSEGRHDVVDQKPYLLFQSNELNQEWIATKGFIDFARGTSGAETTCGGTFELGHDNDGYAKITDGTFKVGYVIDAT